MIDLSLLQDFITESGEHLEEMENSLLRLEGEPDNKELLNDVFRSIHTIKGSAEYLGMEKISELSHKLENVLEIIRHGDRVPDEEMIDTLIDSRDRIARLVHDLEYEGTEKTEIDDLIERIEHLDSPSPSPGIPGAKTSESGTSETKFPELPELALDPPEPSEIESDTESDTVLESPEDAFEPLLLDEDLKVDIDEQDVNEKEPVEHLYEDDEQEEVEYYEEEYDDELFDIFVQHLKENLVVLKAQLIGLSQSPKPLEILNKCLATVSSLRSSANYMDYEKIIIVYDLWQDELEKAVNAAGNKEKIIIAGPDGKITDITSATDAFIEAIVKFFPNLKDSILEEAGIIETKPGKKEPAEKSDEPDKDQPEALSGTQLEDQLETGEETLPEEDLLDFDDNLKLDLDKEIDLTDEDLDFSNDDLLLLSEEQDEPGKPEPPVEQELRDIEEEEDKDEYLVFNEEDFLLTEEDETGLEESDLDKTDLIDDLETETDEFAKDERPEPGEIPEPEQESKSDPEQEQVREPESGADFQGLFDELDCFFTKSPVSISYKNAVSAYQKTIESKEIKAPEPGTPHKTGTGKTAPSPKIKDTKKIQKTGFAPPVSPKAPKTPRKSKAVKLEKKTANLSEKLSDKIVKQSIRVDAGKIDDLMNQVGELVVSRAWFSQLHVEMKDVQTHLQEYIRGDQRVMKPVKALSFRISEAIVALGRVANELQEGVMKVRMLPIAQLFNRYPRLVRDLIHDVNKQVKLEIIGEETELDKMVIEEIADPLVHIIRNAVDHGCEEVDVRREAGKPDECTLTLRSYHESNHVVIEVTDDGRGIDPENIKAAALQKGAASQDELDRMNDRELISLIMKPGFSTAEKISRTSGRGVGMDVVKENIEKLNGTIEIDSRAGEGSRFRIKIPLTLAIIQALLVRVGKELFTIPLTAVEETLRISMEEITTIENVECIYLRNSTLSLIRLSEIFNVKTANNDPDRAFVVVVNTGMRRVGLVVDELIGQEETVIKPIVDYLQEKSGFSGATILGDGRISLILDVYELVNLSIGAQEKLKGYIELPNEIPVKNNISPVAA